MSNILIALPENPAPVVEDFLKTLDPTKDDPSPIPAPVPAMGQLNICLTDFDLGTSALPPPTGHAQNQYAHTRRSSTFGVQRAPPHLLDSTAGLACP